jgi:N-acetylmuramoyl-L-alanine amidase
MKVTQRFLSINDYTRDGKLLKEMLGVILHWTGPNGHTARQVWGYFENNCTKDKHYSSAQYIIDFTGEIIQCIPDNERAFHCGSSLIDPVSEVIYTDWAREKFNKHANIEKYNDPKKIKVSPNNCTIGIEMCSINDKGDFKDATIASAIELVSYLLYKNKKNSDCVGTHNMVVGWKDCPRLWVNKSYLFDAFINDVDRVLRTQTYKNIKG